MVDRQAEVTNVLTGLREAEMTKWGTNALTGLREAEMNNVLTGLTEAEVIRPLTELTDGGMNAWTDG